MKLNLVNFLRLQPAKLNHMLLILTFLSLTSGKGWTY